MIADASTPLCQNAAMADTHPLLKSLRSPRNLKLLGAAFGIGLLLFLMLWADQRNDTDFFKASAPEAGTNDGQLLPAPLPADVAGDESNASGLRLPPGGGRDAVTRPPVADSPRIIEPVAPPPPPDYAQREPAPPVMATGPTSAAVPISRPPPVYPREALRRGVGGIVRVEVSVAADGSVERLDMAESSGNRFLDRAAMEAVRRWRFSPAMRNGQPVSATVVVPIEFNPGR